MAATHYTLRPRPRWTSGALTCLAMFALGGLVLWGLFRAPRAHAPPSPQVPWGIPGRPVRVVCLDMAAWTRNVLDASEQIQAIDPDIVLAQRVPGEAIVPLAEALGMQRTFHPNNFVRLGRGAAATGCLVLSKHPVYDAAPLRPELHPDAPLGVWATVVVDGRRFAVASADAGPRFSGGGIPAQTAAALLDARQAAAGGPPLVAAFRAPEMLSSRAEMLKIARLTEVTGPAPAEPGELGIAPLIATLGPWQVIPETASQPRVPAPGIFWVALGPE